MNAAEVSLIAYPDYAKSENGALEKHEYWDGFVLAMAVGTVRHGVLMSRVFSALARRLKGKPCQPYSSDLRVRVESLNASFYPDFTCA